MKPTTQVALLCTTRGATKPSGFGQETGVSVVPTIRLPSPCKVHTIASVDLRHPRAGREPWQSADCQCSSASGCQRVFTKRVRNLDMAILNYINPLITILIMNIKLYQTCDFIKIWFNEHQTISNSRYQQHS